MSVQVPEVTLREMPTGVPTGLPPVGRGTRVKGRTYPPSPCATARTVAFPARAGCCALRPAVSTTASLAPLTMPANTTPPLLLLPPSTPLNWEASKGRGAGSSSREVEVTARLGDRVRPLSRPARTTGGAFEEVEVVEGVAQGVGEGVRVAVAVAVEVPVAVAVEFEVREGEGRAPQSQGAKA